MDIILWTPVNSSSWNLELESDKTWLDHRVELMNNYVIPSVRNQTEKNFKWFIEIREDTVDYLAPKLNIEGSNGIIIPRKKNMGRKYAWMRNSDDIKEHVSSKKFYDIRLNSDDMLRYDFMEKMRNVKVDKKLQAIIPKFGYFWYRGDDVVTLKNHSSPPFSALIYNTQKFIDGFRYEPKDGHMGIKSFNHTTIEERVWCWIIHEKNQKILRKGGYPPSSRYTSVNKSILKEFGISV